MSETSSAEEEEAIRASGGAAASISASTARFSAIRSGAFSCTISAPPTASASVVAKRGVVGAGPGRSAATSASSDGNSARQRRALSGSGS